MPYRLRFIDPLDHVMLDEHDLPHCVDDATARRWLAAQTSELSIELHKGEDVLATKSGGVAIAV